MIVEFPGEGRITTTTGEYGKYTIIGSNEAAIEWTKPRGEKFRVFFSADLKYALMSDNMEEFGSIRMLEK